MQAMLSCARFCMQVVAVPAAALLEPEWDDGAMPSADQPDYASILFG